MSVKKDRARGFSKYKQRSATCEVKWGNLGRRTRERFVEYYERIETNHCSLYTLYIENCHAVVLFCRWTMGSSWFAFFLCMTVLCVINVIKVALTLEKEKMTG